MKMLYTVLLIAAVVVAAYVLIKILAAPIKKIFKLLRLNFKAKSSAGVLYWSTMVSFI